MNELTIATLCGLGAAVSWGVTDFFSKKGIDVIGSKYASVYYVLVQLLFAFPLLLLDSSIPDLTLSSISYAAIFGFLGFIITILMFSAYQIGRVSVLNPITSAYGAVTSIVSYFIFHEYFGWEKALIIGVIIAGIIMVSVDIKDLKDGFQKGDIAKGIPQIIVVFLVIGAYLPFYDKLLENNGWPILVILISIFEVLIFIFYLGFKEIKKVFSFKWNEYKFVVLGGVFQSIGNILLAVGFVYTNSISIVTTLSTIYPVILVLLGYYFLKEKLATNQYVGIALIILGVIGVTVLGTH